MRILVISFLCAAAVSAQPYRASAHVYYAPSTLTDGSFSTFTQGTGFGADAFVYRGLAVGADLGYFWPSRSFHDGIGVLSANPSYHFNNRERTRRFVPFVTGGYGLLFREESVNVVNFGGGVTVWPWERAGLRFEVRDHVDPREKYHLISFRMGFSFR